MLQKRQVHYVQNGTYSRSTKPLQGVYGRRILEMWSDFSRLLSKKFGMGHDPNSQFMEI